MPSSTLRRALASWLVAGLFAPVASAAAPHAGATLRGTVFDADATKPLAGATVVVTDATGNRALSEPTAKDGAFTVTDIAPGTCRVALTAGGKSYDIATPVALAPGQTRGVELALRSKGEKKKKDRTVAADPPDGKGLPAMIAVIVGFVAAGAIAVEKSSNDNEPASPSGPSH